MMESPAVTVAITTYNHERYIETAIRSALEQQTTFPVEILVADDVSKDNTREIIRRLDREFPGRLTLLMRETNLGLSANLQDCRARARGKYLAVLEGDDIWIDPLKLQKQHDALESHPDWTMCYASSRVFHDDHAKPPHIKPNPPPTRTLVVEDFLRENQVQTMSVAMYRQGIVKQTPPWHAKLRIGDWALHILHADAGPIGFIPDVVTGYRVHAGGLWSGLDSFRQWEEMLRLFEYLAQHFQGSRAQQMLDARNQLMKEFSDRVKDLEKVERRYLMLRLDRVAAVCRWFLGKRA